MENTSWLKQTPDKQLFPDLLWSRPENVRSRGKLLIIGGNLHGFAAPATAYTASTKANIGTARVLLPDGLKKALGSSFPEAEFAASTPSGSFARQALSALLELSAWADGVLLGGDFGRNSETAVLLESFADKYSGQLSITDDAVDYYTSFGSKLTGRYNKVITTDISKLQKVLKPTLIKHSFDLFKMVQKLAEWSQENKAHIITKHADNFIVASGGQVSTTPAKSEQNWQIKLAAYVSVWWLQNPTKPFEALTTAVFDYTKE